MWIKSEKNQYIMLPHISYFEVEPILMRDNDGVIVYPNDQSLHKVVAYLSSQHILQFHSGESQPRPAQIILYTGTEQECKDYIVQKLGIQAFLKALGYVVAGAVGAILTYFLTNGNP